MLRPILNHKVPVKIVKVKLSKDVKHFSVWHLLVFVLVFAGIGGYLIYHSFAITTCACGAEPPPPTETTTNIDYTSQSAVNSAYWSLWAPAMTTTPGWTGSVSGCVPGTMSSTARSRELDAINFARRLQQLKPVGAANSIANANDMKTALILEANNPPPNHPDASPHYPPPTWNCWTQAGATTAGESALSTGPSTVGEHVANLMGDVGEPGVGHRQVLSFPEATDFGIGTTASMSAVQVEGFSISYLNPRPDVMWPMKGYFPSTIAPGSIASAQTGSWSYTSYNLNLSFKAATVNVTHNGQAVPISKLSRDTEYGNRTILWDMPLHYVTTGSYTVTIENIKNTHTGNVISKIYTVHFFDPA